MSAIIRNLIATRWTSRAKSFLAAIVLSGAILLIHTAQAMEIRQFDKMADQDQADYVVALINGAEKVLTDEGKPDLAAKVKYLFTTKNPGDADVIGMVEFELNLAILRENDAKGHINKPQDPWLEVEDVMAATLQKNHIDLPDSFYTVNKNFHPKYPPKEK